ncbi:MAG: class I SAM-dependent methyltransferase [Clostridia bacterium]|nr:class I SAM-dependent methyltransferase [Clostridia bacterium]
MGHIRTNYEKWYSGDSYYWGLEPAAFCRELIRLRPYPQARRVLDIGCGEGKDAVFMAQNGYSVTAFDIAEAGIAKAVRLASERGVSIDARVDDINAFEPGDTYDIVYSSGTIQYLFDANKRAFFDRIDRITNPHGIAFFNVFVDKPFLALPPDWDVEEKLWKPGELFTYLPAWKVLRIEERIFEDDSGGVPHFHCMDTLLCEKVSPDQYATAGKNGPMA